jgi:heme oxygenase (biliverdin-IX-beta and delta-forming)
LILFYVISTFTSNRKANHFYYKIITSAFMFLQNLRNETAHSHLELERNPYSVALMSSEVTLKDYSQYLQKLYGFVLSFESNVYPLLKSIDSDIELRRKSKLMQNDLINLEVDLNIIPIVPTEHFKIHFPDVIAAIGGLYVLEGSMLGGIMIKKHLNEKLGSEVSEKMQYLTGYGSETGKIWKNFLTTLSHQANNVDNERSIIISAKNTFYLLNQWIATSSLNLRKE